VEINVRCLDNVKCSTNLKSDSTRKLWPRKTLNSLRTIITINGIKIIIINIRNAKDGLSYILNEGLGLPENDESPMSRFRNRGTRATRE
jgi:hypothetical protein